LALFWNLVTLGNSSSIQVQVYCDQAPTHTVLRRVFHLIDSFNVGGTESQAVELARRLPATGYEVTVGCLKREGPLEDRLQGTGIAIREFRLRSGIDSPSGLRQLLHMSWFLRSFDIVHTHDLWSNLIGVPAARLAGVPAIISSRRDLSHFEWYQGKRRVWLKWIQSLGSAVVTNAVPIRDALVSEDRFDPRKVHIIHNGVDIAKFRSARNDRVRLFPDAGQGKLVVLVGNMHTDVKGHPWLIASAPEVLREFPDTQFILVGDGEQRSSFEKQAQDLGVIRNFLFLRRRSDIPDILASCDIAVLPSRAEGLPNAVLEYMAAGLPVIVSRVGGNPELVQDGVTGIVVPSEDSAALSTALLKLLAEPSLARRLAQAGYEFAVRNFSFERLVQEVDALYTDLLRDKKRYR
jgi:glycosyltransferase involved in cell wall biosynthesis